MLRLLGSSLVGTCILVCIASVQAAIIYVPDNYSTIQQAVDAANAGDTIIVRDGVYVEKLL